MYNKGATTTFGPKNCRKCDIFFSLSQASIYFVREKTSIPSMSMGGLK